MKQINKMMMVGLNFILLLNKRECTFWRSTIEMAMLF